ncbi:thioesterase II family protein [Streptomyces sp. NBC_00859]|uniref:thioesterase II family protein n=1 Tax=Streptomyces sp. NBC_00859 TaxID=2903682 RepID=UPI0038662E7B|nr:alpha/beta fold hydrolase [Streptomyces sp. NBC_00859]
MRNSIASKWVKRYPSTRGPRLRLLCLPHAGGSAAFFHGWPPAFSDDIEVLVARYPGRHDRLNDPLMTSMDDFADALTTEILPFTDVPLAVFGHSMGASLAYEVALRLYREHNVALSALMVSGRTPPHLADRTFPDPDDVAAVLDEVRRLGGTDTALLEDPDLADLILPAILADFKVVAGYTPRASVALPFPVVAYVGDSDPDVDTATMSGWADASSTSFELQVFPGDHFYLVGQQTELTRNIGSRLRQSGLPGGRTPLS